jgi:hypothetical protein
MNSLDPEAITWTGLLAQWMRFAQASLSLPRDATGERWRASVPPIITLQAVTFALADIDHLPHDERALALDRAELLITQNTEQLRGMWRDEMLPRAIAEIVDDARTALRARLEAQ